MPRGTHSHTTKQTLGERGRDTIEDPRSGGEDWHRLALHEPLPSPRKSTTNGATTGKGKVQVTRARGRHVKTDLHQILR